MAFGAPRPEVTLVVVAMTLAGAGLGFACTGVLRWIGIAFSTCWFLFGLLIGSWQQLLPEGKRVGEKLESGGSRDSSEDAHKS